MFVDGHADVWRLFDDVERLRSVVEALVEPFHGSVTKVAGVESRGFILGTAAALALGVGFVPVRKAAGLFPGLESGRSRASQITAASGTRCEFSGQR